MPIHGFMNIDEAADYFGIKPWPFYQLVRWEIYRLVVRGKIPSIKIQGRWHFKREDLDEIFKEETFQRLKRESVDAVLPPPTS